MFGKYVRAMGLLVVTPILGAFVKYVLGMIIEFMNPPENNRVAQVFIATQQHFILIALFSIVVLLVAGAIRERGTVPR